MKKLILLCFVVFFSSCVGSKKVSEKTKESKITEVIDNKKDSIVKVEKNKEIKDAVTVSVPVVDSITDAKIDEILSKLNTSKSSGSNSYRFDYDLIKRELRAEFTIGETKDSISSVSKESKSKKTFEEKTDEYFKSKIKVIPWWVWGILIILFLPNIVKIVEGIINPVMLLKRKYMGK